MTNENSIGQKNNAPLSADQANGEFLSMHQASKMTGYHQDYLGQLARSGKLEARKVGRNWFTTKYAIDKMLGRVKEEVVQIVEVPVLVNKIETVNVEEVEIQSAAQPIVQTPEPQPEPEPVIAVSQLKKIKIYNLGIANEAGPNLQEALSAPVIEEKNGPLQIKNRETRETYLRWNKISGNQNIFTANKQNNFTAEVEKIKSSSRQIWMYLSSATAVVVLAVVGVNYFLNQTENTPAQLTEQNQQERKVAGESTAQAPQTGTGRILPGEKSVQVADSGVTKDSNIEIVLDTPYKGNYEITEQDTGLFTVTFTPSPTQTLLFEYQIINGSPAGNNEGSERELRN
ncbi:MAG TPA: hypothetical protein VEC17_01120 [Candidatus Binatia bacterium]|nr:hypothetical protein [Candidatus Binatia bacterium]